MCGGGGGPKGPSAAELEDQRRARIAEGMGYIDDTFDQFNDEYYGNIRSSYMDYVTPDFERDYEDAQRELVMQLARQGLTGSSIAADKTADLQDLYNKNSLDIQQRADGYVNDRRSSVEAARGSVVSQLNASSNAGQAATSALNQASTLQALPEFSALGNLFGTALDGLRTQAALEQNGISRYNTGLFQGANVKDASKVVG